MKKVDAVAQVKKGGRLIEEVPFAYEEATSDKEAALLAKRRYRSNLYEVFNRWHRQKEIDRIRRAAQVRLEDPLRDLKTQVRKLLREADEDSLRGFVETQARVGLGARRKR